MMMQSRSCTAKAAGRCVSAPALAALGLALLGPSLAQAQTLFTTRGSGTTFGEGNRRGNPGDQLVLTATNTNFNFDPSQGGSNPTAAINGSTSGGLGEGVTDVANISTTFSAVVLSGLLPGETRVQIREQSQGTFLQPALYEGSITSNFGFLTPLSINVESTSFMTWTSTGFYSGLTGLRRQGDNQLFTSGSVVTPGQYNIIPTSLFSIVTVSDTNPTFSRSSAIDVLLVVPAPGAAGLVMGSAVLVARRRRRV